MTRAWFGNSVGRFISESGTIARGMTDVDVGSSALLGFLSLRLRTLLDEPFVPAHPTHIAKQR